MDREGLSREKLRNARDSADKATIASIVISLALLLSVLSDLNAKFADVRNAVVRIGKINSLAESQLKFRNEDEGLQALLQTLNSGRPSQSDEKNPNVVRAQRYNLHRRIDAKNNKLGYARQAYESKRKIAEDVDFKILGFELAVQGSWAPAVWLIVFSLNLILLAFTRTNVNSIVADAARLHLLELRQEFATFSDAVGDLPLWVRPFPLWACGAGFGVTSLRTGLRLRFSTQWLSVLTVIGVLLCIIAQFRVSFLALLYAQLAIGSEQITAAQTLNWWLVAIVVICAGVTAMIALWWFPARAIDCSFADPRSRKVTRRVFLGSIAGLILSVPLYRCFREARISLYYPRFRKSKNVSVRIPNLVRPGFYEDRITKTIHYVGPSLVTRSVSRADAVDFVPLAIEKLESSQFDRVQPAAINQWVTVVCHTLVRQRNFEDACKLLIQAIRADIERKQEFKKLIKVRMPNLALYDLLAKISVRYRLPKYRRDAIALLESLRLTRPNRKPLEQALTERIRRADQSFLAFRGRLTKHKVRDLSEELADSRGDSKHKSAVVGRRRSDELKLRSLLAEIEPTMKQYNFSRHFADAIESRLSGLRNPNWKPAKIRPRMVN